MPAFSRQSRGFTLWEALSVLLILSLVAALALPQLRPWQIRLQENAEARALLAAFQQARSEAARGNGRAYLEFTLADHSPAAPRGGYRILAERPGDHSHELQGFTPFKALRLEQVSFSQGAAQGGFDFRGLPSHGAGSLVLRSPHDGSTHRLSLTLYGAARLNP
ncbi:GspH/FimT family pseudopilin [Geoalkalibacter halelectricus]|uniref:Type II secretion system protein H n=1 Tax=Geoalkalibacter halelectricus TaxID=2847045 RepID=A0ABY5ZHL8_9BACT|nr:GspH/FimT family pseudopilin [Geoalkalibacter halelectricus]MDO3377780.1 GspH/FimT family pseudopilin [Geoalkalibacter halelectricus]UWZ78627.1 GspH/FimT family pseudopilin [Geoalkalibacter halelectricus]